MGQLTKEERQAGVIAKKAYSAQEREFHLNLKNRCHNLWSDANNHQLIVNGYIHRIFKLKTDEDLNWFNEQAAELEKLYRIWKGDDVKRLHHRHPVLLNNVSQINITINDAYSSIKVKQGEDERFSLCMSDHSADLDKLSIKVQDYDPKIITDNKDPEKPKYTLTISCNKIHETLAEIDGKKVGEFDVQARRRSGHQYVAMVRQEHDGYLKKTRLGLIVLPSNSKLTSDNVQSTLSQKRRNDKLEGKYPSFEIEEIPKLTFFMK